MATLCLVYPCLDRFFEDGEVWTFLFAASLILWAHITTFKIQKPLPLLVSPLTKWSTTPENGVDACPDPWTLRDRKGQQAWIGKAHGYIWACIITVKKMKQRLQNDVMFRHEAHNLCRSVLDISVGHHAWRTEPWNFLDHSETQNYILCDSLIIFMCFLIWLEVSSVIGQVSASVLKKNCHQMSCVVVACDSDFHLFSVSTFMFSEYIRSSTYVS
jgi:hypothetical protein